MSEVSVWLARLEAALARGDIRGTLALFDTACFWRDMAMLTWNIATFEGREAIEAMLASTLARARPRDFRLAGAVDEEDGASGARFVFETEVARGQGWVRLREGRCWTILTAITELKGH